MVLNIQALRALAAMLVVLYHLGPHYQHAGGSFELLVSFAQWGFFGVDIFFVISGFVISYTVFPRERNRSTAAKYWRHRLSRIYLGYWPFALLALYVLPLHGPGNLAAVSAFKTLTLTSADIDLLALPVAWSLAYELYFYAIFGALFLFSNAVIQRVLLLILVLLLLRVLFVDIDPESNFYFWVSAYMLEFFYGVLLYLHRENLTRKIWILPTLVLMLTGFVLAVGETGEHDSRVLYLGISAAAIVLLALQLEVNKWWVGPRWLVSLGDSSYALYLGHLFIISAFYQWGGREQLASQSPFVIETGFLVLLLFIALLCHLYYRGVERPLYLWAIGRSRPANKRPNPVKE